MKTSAYILAIAIVLSSCRLEPIPDAVDRPISVDIPQGFPDIDYPQDNAPTMLRVELGRKLFFDKRLSEDFSTSCSSCHLPQLAFTDGEERSIGFGGETNLRNSPSLINVAWQENLFGEGGVPTLEQQVLAPIGAENEFNISVEELETRLQSDEQLNSLSKAAYGVEQVDLYVVTRAISAYERTLIGGTSRYDDFINGNSDGLSTLEVEGMSLFNSEELACRSCHSGYLFTDQDFHNVGLYEEYEDLGRERLTNLLEDRGKFKTPSLRNVMATAPYMHDGSLPDMQAVIEHFDGGGVGHENQDKRIKPLSLADGEKAAIVAFLHTLTDAPYQ